MAGEQSQQRMDAVERRLDSEPCVRSEEGAHVGEEVKQQLHIHLVRVLRDPLTATKGGSRGGWKSGQGAAVGQTNQRTGGMRGGDAP